MSIQPRPPIPLGPGPHLFADDYLIAESTGLQRRAHQPQRLPEPVLCKAERWHQQPLLFLKIIPYPEEGLFRAWYNVKNPGYCPPVHAYAESPDGIHWTRPHLGLIEMDGSRANNLFMQGSGFGLGLLDDGPNAPDPARRFKMTSFEHPSRPCGLCVAFSPDGLHWTRHPDNPVLPYYFAEDRDFARSVGDISDTFYDPLRRRYVANFSMYAVPSDGYVGASRTGCIRRLVGQSHSEDFVRWSEPHRILAADTAGDLTEFYGMSGFVRGDTYYGIVRVLRDDLPADPGGPIEGLGYSQLAISHDGEHWRRFSEVFFDRNQTPGTWDHALAWMSAPVYVGDEMYLYYGGYSAGHKVGDREIGLATLRLDGYVSREAGEATGTLRTPPVILGGAHLTVNVDAPAGVLRVALLDEAGNALPGYALEDSLPIGGDSVRHPVRWRERDSLAAAQDRPVRLAFELRNASLYAFALD